MINENNQNKSSGGFILALGLYINKGFFKTEADVCITAINEFVRHNKTDLAEKFALEDIAWSKSEAKKNQ